MKNKWVDFRKFSQFFFLIIFIIFLWRSIYPMQGIMGAKLFFAFDPLVAIGISIAGKIFLKILIPAGILIIATIILGRFFCGWMCPMGTMIDICGKIRNNFLKNKQEPYRPWLRHIKTGILIVLLIMALFGLQYFWVGDPITISARFISMNLIPLIINLKEHFFRFIITNTGYPESIINIYRLTGNSMGAIRANIFPNAIGILGLWLVVVMLTLVSRRFWCRNICPLGAMLAMAAKLTSFNRILTPTCTNCKKCVSDCRMHAIKKDNSYMKEECILCMDCIYDCPENSVSFRFAEKNKKEPDNSRRNFIKYAGLLSLSFLAGAKNKYGKQNSNDGNIKDGIIRPPAALNEKNFKIRCIRCGNCMRVCVTNGLQPVIVESGIDGIWTPKLVPEIGYCEYLCTMCGKVCPTGAIPELNENEKKQVRLGSAYVLRSICRPWTGDSQCLVCEEHCPVGDKAIKLIENNVNGKKYLSPVVDKGLCVGCGMCQHVCPERPYRAIVVNPAVADRK